MTANAGPHVLRADDFLAGATGATAVVGKEDIISVFEKRLEGGDDGLEVRHEINMRHWLDSL